MLSFWSKSRHTQLCEVHERKNFKNNNIQADGENLKNSHSFSIYEKTTKNDKRIR